MADRKPVEGIDDLSPRALGELRAWFESWYRPQPIDATVNQGVNYGVRSVNRTSGVVDEGKVLTATGEGGSRWDIASTGFTYHVPSLELAYFTPGHLEGWWRLGEDASTFPTTLSWAGIGDPGYQWAKDSSGNNHHLHAYNMAHFATGPELPAGSTDLPTSITGAIPVGGIGDPTIDDGALQFNYTRPDPLDNAGRVGLSLSSGPSGYPWGEDTDFGLPSGDGHIPVGGGWSLSAFILWPETGGVGSPVLGNGDAPGFGSGGVSWWVTLGAPATSNDGYLTYNTNGPGGSGVIWSTPNALVLNRWYHLAVTIERLGTTSYRRRILLDLNEVYNVTGTANDIRLASTGGGVGAASFTICGYWSGDGRNYSTPCAFDEVSIWSKALTDEELANIYYVAVATGDTWTSTAFISYVNGA